MSQLSLDEQYQRMRSACHDVSTFVGTMERGVTDEELDQMLGKANALIGQYREEAEQYRLLLQAQYLKKLQAEPQEKLQTESNDAESQ